MTTIQCHISMTVFRQGRTLLDQGCPNFGENFFGALVPEKMRSSPSEHFWSLWCFRNAKNVKIVKKQVFEKFQFLQSWLFLKNGRKF